MLSFVLGVYWFHILVGLEWPIKHTLTYLFLHLSHSSPSSTPKSKLSFLGNLQKSMTLLSLVTLFEDTVCLCRDSVDDTLAL